MADYPATIPLCAIQQLAVQNTERATMKRVAGDVAQADTTAHGGHSSHEAGRGGHAEHGEHAGYDKHAGHSVAMFRDKFWLSFILTVPTLVWGHMLPRAFGYIPPDVPGSHWIPPVLGTVVSLYGGLPFMRGAVRELKDRLPGMMTLIALAITVAFVFSAAVTLGYPGTPLWEELATLVTIMLLGHWIEMRSINQAQGALAELLLPSNAVRVIRDASGGERTKDVPLTALIDGDLVLVRPGASIPADGEVREGHSNVNESMITGESRPVGKHAGDHVIAGTVNGEGSLRVTATGIGDRTALAGIMRLVEQTQTSRSRAQFIADRAALWLTLVALGAGALTLVDWLAIGAEPAYAIERLVTVLVVACPHVLRRHCGAAFTMEQFPAVCHLQRRGMPAQRQKLELVAVEFSANAILLVVSSPTLIEIPGPQLGERNCLRRSRLPIFHQTSCLG